MKHPAAVHRTYADSEALDPIRAPAPTPAIAIELEIRAIFNTWTNVASENFTMLIRSIDNVHVLNAATLILYQILIKV